MIGTSAMYEYDRGRTVSCTDYTNRSRIELGEEYRSKTEGKEDTELCRSSEYHQLGVGKHGPEVDHRTYTDKEYEREKLICDACIKEYRESTALRHSVFDKLTDG